jgi:hypothetical protein
MEEWIVVVRRVWMVNRLVLCPLQLLPLPHPFLLPLLLLRQLALSSASGRLLTRNRFVIYIVTDGIEQ